MNLHTVLLCSALSVSGMALAQSAAPSAASEKSDSAAKQDTLSLTVVSFSGGGWGKARKARAALASIPSIEKIRISGASATLIMKAGESLDQEAAKAALTAKGLKMGAVTQRTIPNPVAHYSMKAMGVGWADTCEKARVALEKSEGFAGAFIDRKTDIFLSSNMNLTAEMINKILSDNGLSIKVMEVTKNPTVAF